MQEALPPSGPFFLRVGGDSAAQSRLCFFDAPFSRGGSKARGCVLAVHAFAEEMNKTRAMSAEAARAFAAEGLAVLRIDLTGCGDSDGDFEDATWSRWMADLADAWAWLDRRCGGPRWLWGTRLGALVAEDFAARAEPRADGLLLWQPVVNGAQHLNQFLRLKTVGTMLRTSGAGDATPSLTPNLEGPSPRADLAAGRAVEIAGYRLNAELAEAMEKAQLGTRPATPPRVRWFDVSSQAGAALSPIAARVIDRWRSVGSDIRHETVSGPAFWQTQEVERCEALVAASVEALRT